MKQPDIFGDLRGEIDRIQAISFDTEALEAGNVQKFVEGLQIITQTEGKKSLILNRSQEIVWEKIQGKWERQEKAWFLCLKARRLGMSTLISAVCFARAYLRPDHFVRTIAHDWPGAKYLGGMYRLYWSGLTPAQKKAKPLIANTTTALRYNYPHNSHILLGSANTKNVGTAELIHDLHLSEVAKYEDPLDMLTSILQCIPAFWDTLNFWESTAQGRNHFYQFWKAAEMGESGYEPLFLDWKGFPDYFMVPAGLVLDEEEQDFQQQYGILDEQMAWAQWTRKAKCRGDWQTFHQEYPIEPALAFLSSGMPWFPQQAMEFVRADLQDPIEQGSLEFRLPEEPVVEFKEAPRGLVSIWEWPDPDAAYVIGMDVSEGVGAAYTVITVLKIRANGFSEQVASFRSNRVSAAQAGVEAYKLASFYNRAFMGAETNNSCGGTTIHVLQVGHVEYPQMKGGYPFLYHHVVPGTKKEEETSKVGWYTDKKTRPRLFNDFQEVVILHQTIIRCRDTYVEMCGIQWDPVNEKWLQDHINQEKKLPLDDEVLAYGIALQMVAHHEKHRAMPRAKSGAW